MAVAMLRPGFKLWIAWVGAGALGAAVAASASQPGHEIFGDLAWYLAPIVLVIPLALLQFLVLKAVLRVPAGIAGLWVGLTLAAAFANVYAVQAWRAYVFPPLAQWVFVGVGSIDAQSAVMSAGDYLYPVLLGLAQGVVLVRIIGRKSVAGIWIVANLGAMVISLYLTLQTLLAINASEIDLMTGPAGFVLVRVALAVWYAALTGAVLVAILRMRAPDTAPPLPSPAV